MGLDGVVRQLIVVKADTSDARAQTRLLRGEERKAAQERLSEIEASNKKVDGQIALYTKMAVGVAAIAGAAKLAHSAMNTYLEDVRLGASAAGANLGGLEKATRGLVEQDNLLAFAGKAMNGVWKLNQAEMETVLRGATALRKTMGVELKPTVDALTEAVAKGNTRALREFGIEAKDKQGVLKELTGLYTGLNGQVGLAGDSIARSGVQVKNSFDDIAGELGRMVVELSPAIEAMAKFVAGLADGVKWANRLTDAMTGTDTQGGSATSQRLRQVADLRAQAAWLRAGITGTEQLGFHDLFGNFKAADLERQADELAQFTLIRSGKATREMLDSAFSQATAKAARGDFGGRGGAGGGLGPITTTPGMGNVWSPSPAVEQFRAGLGGPGAIEGNSIGKDQAFRMDLNAELGAAREALVLREQFAQQNLLTAIFGTPSEMDETAVKLRMASEAFGVLSGAATAAFDAWITGQKSIGQAFTQAAAEALRSTATQMLGESIKHAAFAAGMAAFGITNPIAGLSSSQHLHAAGMFAAGAAATGVLAKGLGGATGQWSSGGSASAGGGRAPQVIGPGGGGRGDGTRNTTIILGREYDDMSSRERSVRLNRAIQRGMGDFTSSVRDG